MGEPILSLIARILQEAVLQPPGQRAEFLDRACAGDAALRAKVEELLAALEMSDSFLALPAAALVEKPIPPIADATVADVLPGHAHEGASSRVGPYKLLHVIGEGGMGTVYAAEEEHPRRRVALKLIRPGLMTPQMLRRFAYEADVLGRLEHPGIARIYHAAVTETPVGKQPFFAMELVHGLPLDRWVRTNKPSLKTRLELLIAVCQAVHHAHTKGVVHRDLKPANILITAEGQPKVLDFGIARVTDADVQATTLHTAAGEVVGTLPYMAPEQAAGRVRELDTSSDVYAIGVIAYELLSGRMPYEVRDKPLHQAISIICEQEPTRLSSVNRSLRGDVETIIGKALEKQLRAATTPPASSLLTSGGILTTSRSRPDRQARSINSTGLRSETRCWSQARWS